MIYPQTSPYHTTNLTDNKYLDLLNNRVIPRERDDVYWTVTPSYEYRPDLLAFDLYHDSRLWWVFAQRNPNTIKDPIFDFTVGVKIYIPKLSTLQAALNI